MDGKRLANVWGLSVGAAAAIAALTVGCSSDDKGSGGAPVQAGAAGAVATAGASGHAASGGAGNVGGSDDNGGAGGAHAGAAGSGAGAGGSAGAATGGSGGNAGSGGSMGGPTGIASNLSGVDFQTTEGTGSNIQLVSSNLTVDSQTAYVEWFAEIRNNGTLPACFVQASVDFNDGSGSLIETLMSYSTGDPYALSDVVSTCIPPGGSGVVWANDIPAVAPVLSDIKVAQVKFSDSGLGTNAVPHPSTPVLNSGAITQHSTLGPGFWSFTGTSTATATVYNVKAQAYFKSAAGLIVDDPDAFHLDTYAAGSTWNFESITGYEGVKPTSYLFFWSFLDGAKGAAQAQALNVSELHRQAASAEQLQRTTLEAVKSRRDRVLGK